MGGSLRDHHFTGRGALLVAVYCSKAVTMWSFVCLDVCPGPVDRESRLLGGVFHDLCLAVMHMGYLLLHLQPWDT